MTEIKIVIKEKEQLLHEYCTLLNSEFTVHYENGCYGEWDDFTRISIYIHGGYSTGLNRMARIFHVDMLYSIMLSQLLCDVKFIYVQSILKIL